jgi:hypothetical protein
MLSSYLDLEYADKGRKIGGTGQGFGGYGLGGEYAYRWIHGVMECLGVEDWSDVVGKYVWAEYEHVKVYRITSVITGKTFDPSLWATEEKTRESETA